MFARIAYIMYLISVDKQQQKIYNEYNKNKGRQTTMYKTVKTRNYKVTYHKNNLHGEDYIAGQLEYIGKEYRRINTFIQDANNQRYDFPEIVPDYVKGKINKIYEKEVDNSVVVW